MDAKLIEQFVQALVDSSLSEDRQRYWVHKMEHGPFGDDDARDFMVELADHISKLDDAIAMTEAELVTKEEKLRQTKIKMLPALEKFADEQPELMAAEAKEYKAAIHNAEHAMLAELKGVRAATNEQDIDAIRKKLMGG